MLYIIFIITLNMPSINPEISIKISNLLKTSENYLKLTLTRLKKYDSNGKVPLGVLEYLIDDN